MMSTVTPGQQLLKLYLKGQIFFFQTTCNFPLVLMTDYALSGLFQNISSVITGIIQEIRGFVP